MVEKKEEIEKPKKVNEGRTLPVDFSSSQHKTIEEMKYRFRVNNKKTALREMVNEFTRAIKDGLIDEHGRIKVK